MTGTRIRLSITEEYEKGSGPAGTGTLRAIADGNGDGPESFRLNMPYEFHVIASATSGSIAQRANSGVGSYSPSWRRRPGKWREFTAMLAETRGLFACDGWQRVHVEYECSLIYDGKAHAVPLPDDFFAEIAG